MKFYKPKFWDKRGHISLISILLFPISLIIIIKNYYEESKPKKNYYDFRTICVGNIYIGGTGKTPLSIFLANDGAETVVFRPPLSRHTSI